MIGIESANINVFNTEYVSVKYIKDHSRYDKRVEIKSINIFLPSSMNALNSITANTSINVDPNTNNTAKSINTRLKTVSILSDK